MAIVAIVGRPNVGKSSLFNRIIGERRAIVDDYPGVTRDRLYGEAEWKNNKFYIVDTGGLIINDEHPLMEGMKNQIVQAINESDLVLLVIDGREGPTWMDQDIAMLVRKETSKPVVVVVNKLDDMKYDDEVYGAYNLGFENVIGVSAVHKRGMAELMNHIVKKLPPVELSSEFSDEIKVALVGRPNVGKSSVLNYMVGKKRSMVGEKAGTTRDSIDSVVEVGESTFRFIDTAGMRRRSKIRTDIEYYSLVRTLQSIDFCDVAILVMDASEAATDQDKKLASHIIEKGKGLILLLNKWDLLPKKDKQGDKMRDEIRDELVFVSHAPLLFSSAMSGRGLQKLPDTIIKVHERRKQRFSTTLLNQLLRDVLAFERLPTDGKGKTLRILYCTQTGVEPPTFVFFVNDAKLATQSFHNHIERQIRKLGNYDGVPIRIYWRNRRREEKNKP